MKTGFLLIWFLIFTAVASGQEFLKVRKVSFKGNTYIRSSRLEEAINIKTASGVSERFFKKEADNYSETLYLKNLELIKYLYQKEGFLNVSFKAPEVKVTKNNKVKLTFVIEEGQAINIDKITYTIDSLTVFEDFFSKKDRRNIRLRSQLKVNSRFRDESYYADQAFINEELNNKGFAYASVKHKLDVDTVANKASLNWVIDKGKPCYFGPIVVEGNERVPDKKVVRQLKFKSGDQWSKYQIDESQKQLYNLGMFRVASIKTLMSEEKPDTLPTMITLKEAPRWITRFGVGYGREDNLRVFADIQYMGFLTRTGRANIYGKHSSLEPYNFQFKFTQPAVFFPFNSFIVNPFLLKQDEPGYRISRHGVNFTMLQHFTERFNSSVNFYLEEVSGDSARVFEAQPYSLTDTTLADYGKSGIALGFVYSSGQPILDPVTGFSIAINIKRNGTLVEKSVPFYRCLIDYRKYLGIKSGLTMAFRSKIGLATLTQSDGLVPVEERFFAGGSYSVRGWGRSQLGPKYADGQPIGGNSLLEGSVEMRYQLAPKIIFAAFCDAGNVWLETYKYKLNDLRYAAGFSFRFKTPIGPVGLDFARPIFDEEKKWQIHFNIGNPF